jgi:hypothetical protein
MNYQYSAIYFLYRRRRSLHPPKWLSLIPLVVTIDRVESAKDSVSTRSLLPMY